MSNPQTEEQWQHSFDETNIFDGAGRKNRYTCERCNFYLYTIDRVKGVTPAFLRCRAEDHGLPECDGMMHSAVYRIGAFVGEPDYEWYRPTLKELEGFNPATRDHVEQGGLLLRRIGGDPPKPEPEPEAERVIVARCTLCSGEFTRREIRNASSCPRCNNPGLPISPKDDVQIAINWGELRILTIWAEFWANHIAETEDTKKRGTRPVETVWAIAARLQEQYPSRVPLTLSGEVGQLKEKMRGQISEVELHGVKEGGPLPPKIN